MKNIKIENTTYRDLMNREGVAFASMLRKTIPGSDVKRL